MTSGFIPNPWTDKPASLVERPCDHTGCLNAGHLALKMCVPAQGYDIDMHQPMKAIIGVVVCVEHWQGLGPADIHRLLTAPLVRMFGEFAKGKAPPDFRRAFLEGVNLHNPEWRKFVSRKSRNLV